MICSRDQISSYLTQYYYTICHFLQFLDNTHYRKKIVISEPIKSLGTYEVTVKLHASVTGKLKVKVEEA